MTIALGIEINPDICFGKPCIKGTRLSISIILEWLEAGKSFSDILEAYPFLITKNIQDAIAYARMVIEREELTKFEMAT